MEIAVAMLVIVILVAVVILAVSGMFGKAREAGLDTDLRTVKTAVDAFILECQCYPTEDRKLPGPGQYALIDFDATLDRNGQTLHFYPNILGELPKHWDEGVWRISSVGQVSVDMGRDEY